MVSSVTQTWRVGPRSDGAKTRFGSSDSDNTVAVRIPAIVLEITDRRRGKRAIRSIELPAGLCSFWLDQKSDLKHKEGKCVEALCEIDVHAGGAFSFDLCGNGTVSINGRQERWSRLRTRDQIEIGDWLLVVGSSVDASDHTMLLSLPRNEHHKESENAASFPSVKVILVVSAMALVAGAGLVGFNLAQGHEEVSRVTPTTLNATQVLPTRDAKPQPLAEVPIAAVKQQKIFAKTEFEESVRIFRDGDKAKACQQMREGAALKKNRWQEKAALFVERRCGG